MSGTCKSKRRLKNRTGQASQVPEFGAVAEGAGREYSVFFIYGDSTVSLGANNVGATFFILLFFCLGLLFTLQGVYMCYLFPPHFRTHGCDVAPWRLLWVFCAGT